ncbi:MAG: ABC transporter ATP-binding protein [Halovenus sp.]
MTDGNGPTGTERDPILEATGVTQEFGGVTVLENVSVGIEPGTVTALVGPNGSGKTTLLRILCRVLSPTAGTVTYSGPEATREIGYVQQQPAFRPEFTARETIEFYTALAETTADGVLDRVGLGDAGDRRVGALSGGMTRLLGVAQAAVGDPPVVVMDEPTTGLDPGMSERTFEIVRELATGGTAVLVSSHDLTHVETCTDRTLVLNRGSVVADGDPETLCERHGVGSLWDVFTEVVERPAEKIEVLGADQG